MARETFKLHFIKITKSYKINCTLKIEKSTTKENLNLGFPASSTPFIQCCRNEHEQMNINKHDKQTKHKPTPTALFVVRQRWFAHLTLRTEIFFLFSYFSINIIGKKSKKRSQAGEEEI